MSHPFNLKDPVHVLSVGFGSGLLKPAPGTWGTIAAALIYFFALRHLPPMYFYLLVAITAAAGIYICGKPARDVGTHDHSAIVWDEFVGYWLTIAIAMLYTGNHLHVYWLLLGFVLFRFFDIVKPFPIGLLDKKVHGGVGIMLDDIIAAIYAGIILYASLWTYKEWWLGL